MIISFIGHGNITPTTQLKAKIQRIILEHTAKDEKVLFYLGGYGNFDHLCAGAVKELKDSRPRFESVFITPYIGESYRNRLNDVSESGLYDRILYPPIEDVPYRFAICKRNQYMIDQSDLIIAYVLYTWGGAHSSYMYAKRRAKRIINLAETDPLPH